MKLTGTYDTPNGSKYLQQLCKHFGHKIETAFTAETGVIHFGFGSVDLKADADRLTILAVPENEDTAGRVKKVIDDHLKRFAFREDFEGMTWQCSRT